MPLLLLVMTFTLAACGTSNPAGSPAFGQKVSGPDAKSLSHEQLMDVLHECHRYGASDDPRVKYTIEYCSSAQIVHSMEGYSTPSSAVVDPSLNKLH